MQPKPSAALCTPPFVDYSSQVNHRALQRAPPPGNMAEAKAECNKTPARLFCILSVCNVLWQQRVPAEPRCQVRGLLRRVGHLTGVGLLAPANGEHLWLSTAAAVGIYKARLPGWGVGQCLGLLMAACPKLGNPFRIWSDAFEAAKPAFRLASSYWRHSCFGSETVRLTRTSHLNTGAEKWTGKSEDSFSRHTSTKETITTTDGRGRIFIYS